MTLEEQLGETIFNLLKKNIRKNLKENNKIQWKDFSQEEKNVFIDMGQTLKIIIPEFYLKEKTVKDKKINL